MIAIHLNELDNFHPIKDAQTNSLENFAGLLNVTIVNLKETGRHNDMMSVSFYSRLQEKLPESHCDFVLRETEFRSIAKETLNDFGK